jgi:NitT/TauT family transport system substrate-binding protein
MAERTTSATARTGGRWRWRATALVAVLACVAVACGGDDGAGGGGDGTSPPGTARSDADAGLPPQPLAERGEVRVTVPAKYETFATLFVADAYGEFDRENIDVEILNAPSTDAIPMLQRGDIHVQGCGPSVGFINAIDSGIDLVWAAPNSTPGPTDEPGFWVSKDLLDADGDVDPELLRNATVGLGNLQMGSSNALPVSRFLETIGLELTDLNLSSLNGGDLLAALENGSVQAAWLNSPLWQPIKEAGTAERVYPQGDEPLGGYCLGPNRDADAELLQAFFRAMARANRLYLQDDYHEDAETVQVIAEAIGIDPSVITAAPALRFDPDLRLDPDVATDLQQIWLDVGLLELDEPLPTDRMVDQTLVEQALG